MMMFCFSGNVFSPCGTHQGASQGQGDLGTCRDRRRIETGVHIIDAAKDWGCGAVSQCQMENV